MAPTRALNALRWLCKHAGASWDIGRLRISPELKKKATSTKSQALVVEPGMLQLLEERIESMCRGGDPRWTCLLGSWLVATGCLRYQHLRRSTIRRASLMVFHGHCRKGKQRHARGGFDWCAPAEFASGFNWTSEWLKEWKALSPVAQKSSGICFDRRGTPWNIAEAQRLCQSIFAEFLDNPEQLTTYSWRRMLPTVSHILNMSSSDLCSLGDWQDRSKEPADAGMALHYSSARYAQSLRNKILATSVAHSCEGHSFWEEVLPSDLDGFREVAKEKLALSIARDKETLYAAQPTKESLKTHLQFSRARGLPEEWSPPLRGLSEGFGLRRGGRGLRQCSHVRCPFGPGSGLWWQPWGIRLHGEEVFGRSDAGSSSSVFSIGYDLHAVQG